MSSIFGPKVEPFKQQKYDEIKKMCQERGTLFADPEFPAEDRSIFFSKPVPGQVQWKRPKEISDDPHLFVEGASSGDVSQGSLGNCWFVASCSSLAQEKELWSKVVPNSEDQEWDADNPQKYAGIFHFRFWRFGRWLDVVVDDRLPTINGKLIFVHSSERNEYWSALLEKAYAKLSGCYENLDGGNTADALVDFTGGVAENINLMEHATDEDKRNELFKDMTKCLDRRSLMSSSIRVESAEEMEAKTSVGLVKGHAYGVTAIRNVKIGDPGLLSFFKNVERIPMVRLRNPWGEKEWNGAWSDGSDEWKKVSQKEREKMGLTFDDDGEFWMSFVDFCRNFTNVTICRLPNTAFISFSRTWREKILHSKWEKHADTLKDRAGGCINNRATFLQNPQFMFDITDNDGDDVMVSISQRDTRADIKQENLTIGFQIMKVESNRKYRCHVIKPKVLDSTYINARSVFEKKHLPEGRYVVVATTFDPGEEGDLMFRIFTEHDADVAELTKDCPTKTCWSGIFGYPSVVTSLTVNSVAGLQKMDRFGGGADPYAYIKCEGDTYKSPVKKGTLNPEWNFSVLLFRKKPEQPLTIQIWNSNLVKDDFMGEAIVMGQADGEIKHFSASMNDRGRKANEKRPGSLSLSMVTNANIKAL
ncbi:calpain-5-like [Ptychodera flava]|uniref:calpain-5-like n=1 Tax=Ptychodera flava TaxID=63121 RepID=UPI00396A9FCD